MPRNQHYNIMDKNVIKEFIANVFGEPGEYMLEQIKDNQILFIENILNINESSKGYYDIMKFAISNMFMCRVLSDDVIGDFYENKEICSDFIDDYISFFDWIIFREGNNVEPEKFMRIMDIEKPIINDWITRFNKVV